MLENGVSLGKVRTAVNEDSEIYLERERDFANEEKKQPERLLILDYFSTFKGIEFPTLLSMPTIHWSFESQLLQRIPQCKFVALDWSWKAIGHGRGYMPKTDDKGSSFGKLNNVMNGEIEFVSTNIAHWIHMSASGFLSIDDGDMKSGSAKERFKKTFRRNSYVWLDFTSQLCEEVRVSLQGLANFLDPRAIRIPVAVTFMAARDNHTSHEDRVKEVTLLLNAGAANKRAFVMEEWRTYVHGMIPMLTVMGSMNLIKNHSPNKMIELHKKELGI